MSDRPDPQVKRYYVLTLAGEQGPCTLDDLRELWSRNLIGDADMVRTGQGRNVGRVAAVLAQHQATAPAAPPPRHARSGPLATRAAGREARSPLLIPVVALIAFSAVAIAVFGSRTVPPPAQPAPVPAAAAVEPPELSLAVGAIHAETGKVEVVVRSDRPAAAELIVGLRLQGPLRMDPAGGATMRVGADSATVTVWRDEEAPAATAAQPLGIALAGSSAYRIGAPATLAVPVPTSTQPTIAWDPFARTAQADQVGGRGWKSSWSSPLAYRDAPLATTPASHSRAAGHVEMPFRSGLYESIRPLAEPVTEGRVWMSVMMRGVPQPDGNIDWCGIYLATSKRWNFGVVLTKYGGKAKAGIGWVNAQHENDPPAVIVADIPVDRPFLVVLALTLGTAGGAFDAWIDPPAGPSPPGASIGHRESPRSLQFDRVILGGSPGCAIALQDLRIGRTWAEVAP